MLWAVTFCAAWQKNPSLSGASSSTKITMRPARISSMPSSIVAMGMSGVSNF